MKRILTRCVINVFIAAVILELARYRINSTMIRMILAVAVCLACDGLIDFLWKKKQQDLK